MIYLYFIEPNDAIWMQWINDCITETDLLIKSHQDENPIRITDLYKAQKNRYYDSPFYGKCAYCESKIEVNSPTYVEHFRPKGGIRNMDNSVIEIGNNIPHPGYYWLAYNWQNLLPTCWNCNTWHEDRSGEMVGKGNRFPLLNQYALNPGDEVNELCLLINPMIEEPKDHLTIDELGILHSTPGSEKANITITLLGLNTREALANGRKREYENIKRKVKALFSLDDEDKKREELEDLRRIARGEEEFTIAARRAIEDVLNSAQNISHQLNNSI